MAGYLVLDGCGFAWMSPSLLLVGSLLDSLAEAWLFVLAYVAFAQLEATRRPIVAMGACLGAYLLQLWASVLAPTAAVIANAICFAVLSLCVRSLVARPLRQAQRSEPQVEMAVANPQSFLPTGHLLFVTIFVFSIAQGLVIALLGWTEEALVWTSFASAMVFVTFCFLVLKNVSFAEAIGAIQTPEPAVAAAGLEEGGAVAGSSDEVSVSTRCDAVAAAFGLTPRESEVFALLAQGRTVGVIREKLVISLNTARFHTKNIYAKLGVHSQQELIDVVEAFGSASTS
ncbi:response regulator transcription factor [Adlercreutzia caecimuris]|uniref:response regulator transcription factor n=1 Tax=Adlercreutzia caecimuris TaxID=671266 RepID=UPI00272A7F9D|nr:helix-turn-helix transcriptional regulator [Adlercreutzia caecimuris]